MNRRRHCLLYLGHSALFTWLAYCAVVSAWHHSVWACAVFAAGSGLTVVAFMREGALEDALRREAAHAERKARPAVADTETSDGVVAVALAAACCEQWWPSAGTAHEPTCPKYQNRSAA